MAFKVHGTLGPPEKIGDFAAKFPKVLLQVAENQHQFVRTVVRDLFTKIIERSPVDTGYFRSNWNATLDEPDFSTTADPRVAKSGTALGRKREMARKRAFVGPMPGKRDPLQQVTAMIYKTHEPMHGAFRHYVLANGVPYAAVLEFGMYPTPVKKGTYVGGEAMNIGGTKVKYAGHYEVRSAGGYSKQAPQGMIRISLMELDVVVQQAEAILKRTGG